MDGEVVIGVGLETKNFDAEIKAVERKLNDMIADYETMSQEKGFDEQSHDAVTLRENIEKLSNRLVELRKKQQDLNDKRVFDGIGNSITNIIKKTTKWALAIFGIRSAYSFVRSAMSTLSQYNDQLATDVEYIRYALATTLQKVIEDIIKLVYKLMVYVAYLAKAWFNVDLFANASAKSFNKANKSAKELSKTLAGFDKINALNDNGSVGVLGGISTPSVDLSEWQSIKIPDWLVWIKDHGELIKNMLLLIGGALVAIKLGANGLLGLGIGVALLGVVKTIEGIIEFINDPSWSNFGKILEGLSISIIGVSTAMIALNATNPVGWIGLVIGTVGLLISSIVKCYGEMDEARIHTDNLKQSQEQLKEVMDELYKVELSAAEAWDKATQEEDKLRKLEELHRVSGWKLHEEIANGTKKYGELTEGQKEVYKQYLKTIEANENLEKVTQKEIETQEKAKQKTLEVELANLRAEKSYDKYGEAIVKAYNNGEIEASEANRLIGQVLNEMDEKTRKTFLDKIPESIKKGLSPSWFEKILEPLKTMWDGLVKGFNATFNVKTTTSTSGKKTGFAKGGIAYYNPVKLATGAVINQPGRGVPLRNAIGGEAGAEGIIPLTDEAALERIGSTIGKHTKFNADITLELEGRILARVMEEINANRSFARNGG